MEKFLKNQIQDIEEVKNLKKVLIATLYDADAVLLASNRLSADRLILLIDEKPDKKQEASLKLIQESLGRVIDVKTVKISEYDVVAVATKSVEIIDAQPKEDTIYINITSGRKTQAIGLLYAAHARSMKVKKIAYNPEDKGPVIYLPKLAYNLTESQRKVLEHIKEGDFKTHKELTDKMTGLSPAMVYKNIKDLQDLYLIEIEEGFKLTDAGRIMLL
ncbi:MAG: DUF6293 family protein [Nanoarchaeota archaeon]|nr:hypothetical protein [Nanoarchaeota archaeon]MBU1030244.1 hypothetical protein [Nanoarchaeota archaeon]MBU1850671.1 hypothetical protein [Nanoarchaeota archaeon]